MIELLVVTGVLIILIGIVMVGIRPLIGGGKEQQTRLVLQNLRNMLAEYEAATGMSKGPPGWWWYDGTQQVAVTAPPADFWRAPYPLGAVLPVQPLDAPTTVSSQSGAPVEPGNPMRNASRAILNTQQAMRYILSVPSARQMMRGFESDKIFIPHWENATLPLPGGDRVFYTQDDTGTAPVQYLVGNVVQYDGRLFRCIEAHASGTGAPPPPSATTRWIEFGRENPGHPNPNARFAEETPAMFLDAWGNPILFVPATGLLVRHLNAESANDASRPGQTFVIVSPEGAASPGIMPNTAGELVRPGKPFFVSAGPDGDFTTGDDNIYSFE